MPEQSHHPEELEPSESRPLRKVNGLLKDLLFYAAEDSFLQTADLEQQDVDADNAESYARELSGRLPNIQESLYEALSGSLNSSEQDVAWMTSDILENAKYLSEELGYANPHVYLAEILAQTSAVITLSPDTTLSGEDRAVVLKRTLNAMAQILMPSQIEDSYKVKYLADIFMQARNSEREAAIFNLATVHTLNGVVEEDEVTLTEQYNNLFIADKSFLGISDPHSEDTRKNTTDLWESLVKAAKSGARSRDETLLPQLRRYEFCKNSSAPVNDLLNLFGVEYSFMNDIGYKSEHNFPDVIEIGQHVLDYLDKYTALDDLNKHGIVKDIIDKFKTGDYKPDLATQALILAQVSTPVIAGGRSRLNIDERFVQAGVVGALIKGSFGEIGEQGFMSQLASELDYDIFNFETTISELSPQETEDIVISLRVAASALRKSNTVNARDMPQISKRIDDAQARILNNE